MERTIEPIANHHCGTGENPLWDDRRQLLYWEDIPRGRVFQYDPASGAHEKIHEGEQQIGGFTLQQDGKLLLFRERDIAVLHADGTAESLIAFDHGDIPRFNDVMADPEGRVFAGTMGNRNDAGGTGGLFRFNPGGEVTELWRGTCCSNGMGFSPDLRTFYWTDSTARTIEAFDYDRATGELSDRRLVLQVGPDEGTPDGMTVDQEGNIWSARWDGFGVYKYTSAGELIEKVEFPVAKVSSCIFGGAKLTDLYVTTAGGTDDDPADRADGTLYVVRDIGVAMGPEFRSRIKP